MMQAFRAALLDFVADPAESGEQSIRYHTDGLLLVEQGRVKACGDYQQIKATLPDDIDITDYRGYLIMPGFIDTHVHYAQTGIIASYGEQLLDWLKRYTFPAERKFSDPAYAREAAQFFLRQLFANGTTTALVFATVHVESVDAIFDAAAQHQMRLISGKVMMDRHAPDYLLDNAQDSYDDSRALIEKWHGKGRLSYAVTPRFAPTSSEAQLELAGQLWQQYDGVYLQSHVAENESEVAWVRKLFPWSRSYLDVYEHFGLLGERSVYAHGIYLNQEDRKRMADTGTALSFCPTSNLFLGSGLLEVQKIQQQAIRYGFGTDVGGGTSFSLFRTAQEGYKISQLTGHPLSPLQMAYRMTLGGARSLYLDDVLGNFECGKEADFVVIDPGATELMQRRLHQADAIDEQLFALIMLGDDRNIVATHVLGECVYRRPSV